MDNLPAELKLHIFSHLTTYTSILSLRNTSPTFHALFSTNKETILTRLSTRINLNHLMLLALTPHYRSPNRARFLELRRSGNFHLLPPDYLDENLLALLLRVERFQTLFFRLLPSYNGPTELSYSEDEWRTSIYSFLVGARLDAVTSGRPGALHAEIVEAERSKKRLYTLQRRSGLLMDRVPAHLSFLSKDEVRDVVVYYTSGIYVDGPGDDGMEVMARQWLLVLLGNRGVEEEWHVREPGCGCVREWRCDWEGDRDEIYRIMREVSEWGQEGELEMY